MMRSKSSGWFIFRTISTKRLAGPDSVPWDYKVREHRVHKVRKWEEQEAVGWPHWLHSLVDQHWLSNCKAHPNFVRKVTHTSKTHTHTPHIKTALTAMRVLSRVMPVAYEISEDNFSENHLWNPESLLEGQESLGSALAHLLLQVMFLPGFTLPPRPQSSESQPLILQLEDCWAPGITHHCL